MLDPKTLYRIVGGNRRFADPFSIPEPYYIVNACASEQTELAKAAERFYEKLRYAAAHADGLIEEAFDDTFYDFYGVNRTQVKSPAGMCSGLYFDSFVLDMDTDSICACLSNDQFMFGHFIDVSWDGNWNVKSLWIN